MSINSMDDISIRIKENYKWIYTYDYAPDSVWDEWRSEVPDYFH